VTGESVFAFVPVGLKLVVPGYRQRLLDRHAALLDAIRAAAPHLRFGADGGVPWIASSEANVKLFGFGTEPKNAELYDILKPALPPAVRKESFRLAKDFVTRWIYPHMRPDLGPQGYPLDRLHGLHGQHKDNIASIDDPAARDRLARAFRPSPADVIVDCGAFLGFGSIRMSRDTPEGRVIAVEASSDCHALLQRNVDVNGARTVTPLHRAIWNAESEFTLEKSYAQGNTLVAEVQRGETHEKVKTISIDRIVSEHALSRLDMVSLTLNGAEVEALQGAKDALTRLRPRIRAAGWYSRGGRRIAGILRDELAPYEYDVFVGPRNNFMALPRERFR